MEETSSANLKRGAQKLLVALLFCVIGVTVNIIGSQVAGLLNAPVFLDSVGTMVTAILGGPVPGIVVGYFTNLFNSLFDETTLYYGVVSVLIAVSAALFERAGWFRRPLKAICAIVVFGLIGGGISSIITWYLFGFGFSGGISTPLAQTVHDMGVASPFAAQFLADFLVDVVDKAIVLAISLLLVRTMPEQMRQACDFSIWQQEPLTSEEIKKQRAITPRVSSLRTKLVAVVSVIMILVGMVTSGISFAMFNRSMVEEQSLYGKGITDLVLKVVDGNKVAEYLELGDDAPGYADVEAAVAQIRDSFEDVEYIYVYQIKEDGCHVVLDPDTADEPGSDPGDVIPFDADFSSQLDLLLAGEPVEPVISNGSYGWLLSVYQPLRNSDGQTVAYVAADIIMNHLIADGYAFLARIISLCVAFFIMVCFLVVWLSDYGIIYPLNSIARAISGFAFNTEGKRERAVVRMRGLNIHTGDEVENLYLAIAKTVEDSVQYIADATEQAQTIERMQSNLIMVMADLVESRDQFTGDHIRKTAAYVRVIMDQMRKEGIYADHLTDEFVYDVAHSAPLHDIGKIAVSDTILNKPGRLTDEEFRAMQNHTVAGAQILESAVDAMSDPAYLDEARRLAIAHHEKWNGQGYPYGLAGEEIPLSARIMAVADVFDALVSKRSYKEGFPISKALDIIREGIGTHFDPLVAQAFLDAEDEVRRIAEEHGDDKGTQAFDVHDLPATPAS